MSLSDQLADIQAELWDGVTEEVFPRYVFICPIAGCLKFDDALNFLYSLGMTNKASQFRAAWDEELQFLQPCELEPDEEVQGCRFMFLEFAYLLALDLEEEQHIIDHCCEEPV